MPPPSLVIATANPHKVAELRAIFAAAGINVLGLTDLPNHERFHEPVEHGATCRENARIKSLSYAQQTGRTCLADDSGLEIDALNSRPGVISSHYSTDGRETGMTRAQRDAANNARVLRELEGVPPDQRTARFVCCMCVAAPASCIDGASRVSERNIPPLPPSVLAESRGTFEGHIGLPPRVPAGDNGFGYDPLFLVAPEFIHTGAELPIEEKNRLSHRARAASSLILKLRAAPIDGS